MNRLKWWFIVVGVFYTLLALMNLYAIFINPSFIRDGFPFPIDDNGLRAAMDLWLVFVLDLAVTGPVLIWASREPLKHSGLVWLVVWLEAIRGVVDDLYLISRGYDPAGYVGFIVIHLFIIFSGILFLRQAQKAAQAGMSPIME